MSEHLKYVVEQMNAASEQARKELVETGEVSPETTKRIQYWAVEYSSCFNLGE